LIVILGGDPVDKLSGMLALIYATETSSFTQAAQRLGISPSGVSKAISRLESLYGVRLLQRTARSVALTPEGATYYERCKRIVAEIEDAEHVLNDVHTTPSGLLRVTQRFSIGRLHFASVLPDFANRYPEIQL